MLRRISLCLVVVLALSCLVVTAAPNFSGKWVLNKDQSEVRTRDGEKPDVTMTVEQTAEALNVKQESSSQFMNREYNLKLNGQPQEIAGRGGRNSTYTPTWENEVLVITRVRENQQGEKMTSTEKWQLSADGKTLTIASKTPTPDGERESKMVFQKQ